MKVAIWDTYVEKKDGKKMHFDIAVPEEEKNALKIYHFGQEYLKGKDVQSETLSAKECVFCHIENANEVMVNAIQSKGYYIIEMENCD
ncbi:DUF2024 family protein [Saccharicrinis fermentans]|uniref:DUF2024 domain-containing protein n=1 Tax=Saccharicrinis fermentans DSM 9555 = JCM 21142 TaxID=869213 RepID=W7Y7W4_9BACT|nr:DUF2024 family protein [Saccharicrinis fermentans]GAF04327.1 hypothetical protein JCM21142_73029 [Saccharicrinis fermentans DSM 9555 = JCM 21142]